MHVRRAMLMLGALCVVTTSCASAQSRSAGRAVPWVNHPALRYTPPPLVMPAPYSAVAPACRARRLRVTDVEWEASAGTGAQRFVFTNIGRATCMLGGYPQVTGDLQTGTRAVLHIRHRGGGVFSPVVPADIAPGHHGYLDVGFSDACPVGRTLLARRLAFVLPGGGTVRTRYRIWRNCHGHVMSRLGRFAPEPEPPRRVPGTPDTLRVRLSVRNLTHVRAGTRMHFAVTLTNPTHTTVRLDPCPSYTQGVYIGRSVQVAFVLNCDPVRTIRPGQMVRYAMQLAMPSTVGLAKVGWHLNTPNEPAAVAVIVIDPAARAGSG